MGHLNKDWEGERKSQLCGTTAARQTCSLCSSLLTITTNVGPQEMIIIIISLLQIKSPIQASQAIISVGRATLLTGGSIGTTGF